MIKQFDYKLFERVFSDAHVYDVDFSEWDQRITLWVLADHYEDWTSKRPVGLCPTIVVNFESVQTFACEIPPSGTGSEWLNSPKDHLKWCIDDFEVEQERPTIRVRLWGSQHSPSLTIECKSIMFRREQTELLDKVFPGWSRPGSGLARPGIDKFLPQKGAE